MQRSELIGLSIRVLLIWAGLTALGWQFGERLAQAILPLVEFVIRTATEGISPGLSVVGQGADAKIHLSALLVRPMALTANHPLPAGTELGAEHHVLHALVPLIIQFSVLLSWPVKGWKNRSLLLSSGLLAAAFVVALTAPFTLLALMEIQLQETALRINETRPEPLLLEWLYFCEMGGAWLIGIAAALACILATRGPGKAVQAAHGAAQSIKPRRQEKNSAL